MWLSNYISHLIWSRNRVHVMDGTLKITEWDKWVIKGTAQYEDSSLPGIYTLYWELDHVGNLMISR